MKISTLLKYVAAILIGVICGHYLYEIHLESFLSAKELFALIVALYLTCIYLVIKFAKVKLYVLLIFLVSIGVLLVLDFMSFQDGDSSALSHSLIQKTFYFLIILGLWLLCYFKIIGKGEEKVEERKSEAGSKWKWDRTTIRIVCYLPPMIVGVVFLASSIYILGYLESGNLAFVYVVGFLLLLTYWMFIWIFVSEMRRFLTNRLPADMKDDISKIALWECCYAAIFITAMYVMMFISTTNMRERDAWIREFHNQNNIIEEEE